MVGRGMSSNVRNRTHITVGCGLSAAIGPESVSDLLGARTQPDGDYGDLNAAVGVFGVVLACGAAWAAVATLLWMF